MKKLAIIFGVILTVLISGIIIIPLVVDVDHYRPRLVTLANQKINGQLTVGKLSLSLWGHVQIQMKGLKLTDVRNKEVLGAEEAFFQLPLWSLITGAPVVTLKVNHPRINVVKDRRGKVNLLELPVASPKPISTGENSNYDETTAAGAPVATIGQEPKQNGAADSARDFVAPSLFLKARLGLEFRDALLTYVDEVSAIHTEIKETNLVLRDLSLSHPTELEFWANLDTRYGKTLRLNGPAKLTGRAEPRFENGKFVDVKMAAHLDLDPVSILIPGIFEKKAGQATSADLSLLASGEKISIDHFTAKFLNAEIQGDVQVELPQSVTPAIALQAQSNTIDLKAWATAIPQLAEYELAGTAALQFDVRGPTDRLKYQGQVNFKNVTAKLPQFKVPPVWDGEIHVATDQVDRIFIHLSAPGSDLKIQGKLDSFSRPRLTLRASSSGIDFDQWVIFPAPGQSKKGDLSASADESSVTPNSRRESTAQTPVRADYDAQLATLRENEWAKKTTLHFNVDVKSLRAKGITVSQLLCYASFDQLTLGLDGCSFHLFGGEIKPSLQLRLAPSTPNYQWSAAVRRFDLGQAVASQLAMFKNTLTGWADLNLKGSGASLNPTAAMSRLKMEGQLQVNQANFVTIDIAKMVSEALNQSLNKIAGQVPGLQGKKLPDLPAHSSKYESITSHFSVQDGKFTAPDFYAQAVAHQGIDLRGRTALGLLDESLDVSWSVIDTYNLTRARDLTVEAGGRKSGAYFSRRKFAGTISCTCGVQGVRAVL